MCGSVRKKKWMVAFLRINIMSSLMLFMPIMHDGGGSPTSRTRKPQKERFLWMISSMG